MAASFYPEFDHYSLHSPIHLISWISWPGASVSYSQIYLEVSFSRFPTNLNFYRNMPEHNHLKLDNISKRYNAGPYIISDFSYVFEAGNASAFIGPNGSGKTTLMRMLSVSAYPTSGIITYGNIDISQHPHQYLSNTGIVYDQPDLPHYLTTIELMEWVMRNRKLWNEETPKHIDTLLNRFDAG